MRVLIAIQTCHRLDYGCHDDIPARDKGDRLTAIRSTWFRGLETDHRLFFGRGSRMPAPDEVLLDCPDDYQSLPWKSQAICRWALDQGYDLIYKSDDDAYVWTDRLLGPGLDEARHHDYTGYCLNYPRHLEWARYAQGLGMWLSRRSMEVIAHSPPTSESGEDLYIGKVLYRAGIKVHRDTRYLTGFDKHYVPLEELPEKHPYISVHVSVPDIYRLHGMDPGTDCQQPVIPINEPQHSFRYGRKHPECPCSWCL